LHTNTDEERTVVCGHLILNIVSYHGQRHHSSWGQYPPPSKGAGDSEITRNSEEI